MKNPIYVNPKCKNAGIFYYLYYYKVNWKQYFSLFPAISTSLTVFSKTVADSVGRSLKPGWDGVSQALWKFKRNDSSKSLARRHFHKFITIRCAEKMLWNECQEILRTSQHFQEGTCIGHTIRGYNQQGNKGRLFWFSLTSHIYSVTFTWLGFWINCTNSFTSSPYFLLEYTCEEECTLTPLHSAKLS